MQQHQQQHQHQHQHQQRNSFFRANRPGNLNIIDINDSSIQQQQISNYNQPTSAGYSTTNQTNFSNNINNNNNNQTTYASTSNNTSLTSPNYQIQTQLHQQQQQQNPISPSYHTYHQTPKSYNQSAQQLVNYEKQSYTPTYSPCPSSAHIVNKQNYFNFDLPNSSANTSNQIPQSPKTLQSNQQYAVPNSPHLSNQTKQLTISTNYNNTNRSNTILSSPRYINQSNTVQQQQQQQSQQPYNTFSNNTNSSYQKLPHTPVSALPFQSYTNQLSTHHSHHSTHNSLSVPNSPINPYHNHHHQQHSNLSNQHSVFQFNANSNSNTDSKNSNTNTNTTSAGSILQVDNNQRYQQTTNYHSSYYQTNSTTSTNQSQTPLDPTPRTALSTDSFEFSTVDDVQLNTNQVTNDLDTDLGNLNHMNTNSNRSIHQTNNSNVDENLVTATFGENDVDMVQEVINDMMQKEETLNNSNNYLMKSDQSTASSSDSISSSPQSNINNNSKNQSIDNQVTNINLSNLNHDYSQTSNNLTSSKNNSITNSNCQMDINNNNNNNSLNLNKNNLDNLTSVANLLLNQNQSTTTSNSSTNINKPSIFSLSNLSEAASAEFLLNFGNNSNGLKQKIEDTNTTNVTNNNNNNNNKIINTKNNNKLLNNNSFDNSDLDLSNDGSNSIKIHKSKQKIPSSSSSSTSKLPSNIDNILYSNSPQQQQQQQQQKLIEDNYALSLSMSHENKSKFLIENNNLNSSISMNSSGSTSSIQSCSDCGKVFTNKSALAKHRLIHSNERKYSCNLCDKSFKRQDHLNGHLLTHQDKKPFMCKAPGCDKSYCDSRSLKRHVESQHQDYLALLANGNREALNYLPNIGKIKANLAPNLQQEIPLENIIKTNKNELKINQQYSPITPVPGQSEDAKKALNQVTELNIGAQRPKNFFTFEEPKPEKCKICGKGFKNIPALNGHMRLHGGFIKTNLSINTTNDSSNNSTNNSNTTNNLNNNTNESSQHLQIQQPHSNASNYFNDDSTSSNCSSNNSFSSNLSSNNFFGQALSKLNTDSFKTKQKQRNLNEKLLINNTNKKFTQSLNSEDYSQLIQTSSNLLSNNTNKHLIKNDIQPESVYYQTYSVSNLNSNQFNNNNNNYNNKTLKNKSNNENANLNENSLNNPPKFISGILQQHHPIQKQQVQKQNEYSTNNLFQNRYMDSNQIENSYQSERIKYNQLENSMDIDAGKSSLPFSNLESQKEKKPDNIYVNNKSELNNDSQQQNNFQTNFNQIYNITTALLNQSNTPNAATIQAAATAAAFAAVASISNQQNETNTNNLAKMQSNVTKPKPKPMPLVIPDAISAFQQQQQQQQQHNFSYQKPNIPYYHQSSIGSSYMSSHIYPHATLLKSPRLLNYDTKKQYTPPPMLSPFRKGPGLFYNPKHLANLFMMQSSHFNSLNNKNPLYNHSISCSSYIYPSQFNFNTTLNHNSNCNMTESVNSNIEENNHENNTISHHHYNQQDRHLNENLIKNQDESIIKQDKIEDDLSIKQENLNENSSTKENLIEDDKTEKIQKPSLIRSRLLSQISHASNGNGAFFSEESIVANEAIASALIDCTEQPNTKPFINIGDEFQATLPDFKKFDESDNGLIEKEDLMWSSEKLSKINSNQLANYLDLICKSLLVYGSSNNLELGLHILNYFDGDVKKSIKSFLDDSIDLPLNHPITTYKYSETDIWTQDEIKKFEQAILKHDKVFSEISNELETKTIKQCIEFYYLWKKVMSDSMKKKWKSLKKNRAFEDTIEQNLRSSNITTTTTSNSTNNTNENDKGVIDENNNELNSLDINNENEFDDESYELNSITNSSKSYLKETQKTKSFDDKSRLSTPSPSFVSNGLQRFECDKCNSVFKTRRKLKQHTNFKH